MVFLIGFYILIPLLIIYLCSKYVILERIGAVLIAYAIGLIIGNTGVLSPDSSDILSSKIKLVQEYTSSASILLALPLLLFGTNLKKLIQSSRKMILSMIIAMVSVVIIIYLGYFIFNDGSADFWKIPGLLVGLYTGGTPNLASLKMMLEVHPDIYIITHTYDTIISAIYLLFLMTIGKTVFRSFLPVTDNLKSSIHQNSTSEKINNNFKSGKSSIKNLSFGFLITIIIIGISVGTGLGLVAEKYQMMYIILMVTTLSLIAASNNKINRLPYTFDLGMYFIIVFSLVVASMADFRNLVYSSGTLLMYITFAIFGTLLLHSFISKVFKIDADSMIITSTTLICSPPFVPVIASSLKNRELIASGLAIGIFGYAIGNYLGVLLAMTLK